MTVRARSLAGAALHHGGVDLVRHALAIAVIVMHAKSNSRHDPQTLAGLDVLTAWIDSAVLCFFVVSGLVTADTRGWSLARGRQLLKRYMGPYLLFSAVYAVALVTLGIAHWTTLGFGVLGLHGAALQLYFLPRLALLQWVSMGLQRPWSPDQARWLMLVCATVWALLMPSPDILGADYPVWPLYVVAFAAGGLMRASTVWQLRWGRVAVLCVAAGAVGLHDPRFIELAVLLPALAAVLSVTRGLAGRRFPGSGGVFLLHAPILNHAVSTGLQSVHVLQWANVCGSVALTYGVALLLTLWFIRQFPDARWVVLE